MGRFDGGRMPVVDLVNVEVSAAVLPAYAPAGHCP
ncbi:hypothetical protein L901_25750 [Agrobacterium sp. D14]|nr:hypothetical protein L901_25750 [Agrobacterium sp. D14]